MTIQAFPSLHDIVMIINQEYRTLHHRIGKPQSWESELVCPLRSWEHTFKHIVVGPSRGKVDVCEYIDNVRPKASRIGRFVDLYLQSLEDIIGEEKSPPSHPTSYINKYHADIDRKFGWHIHHHRGKTNAKHFRRRHNNYSHLVYFFCVRRCSAIESIGGCVHRTWVASSIERSSTTSGQSPLGRGIRSAQCSLWTFPLSTPPPPPPTNCLG